MSELTIAVCDDELSTLDVISSSICATFGKRGVTTQIDSFFSIASLEKRMESKSYDLLFLDIQMPGEGGIEFANRLRERGNQIPIVYVSSREEKVFDALLTQPFGFVRKGNFLKDVVVVVNQFLERREKPDLDETLILRQNGGILRIGLQELVYVEGAGKSQLLHLREEEKPRILYSTMETVTEQLEPHGFLRIHKGYLVNFRYIDAIQSTTVSLVNGETLPLSRREAQQVKDRYMTLLKGHNALLL